jgi:hypothetical protein
MPDVDPRWGGVARRPDSEMPEKPQQQSGYDFRTLQDRAGSNRNVTGTCEKSGTRLTQPVGQAFAGRSEILLRVASIQLPRLSPGSRAALRKYVERDMEASNG